MKDKRYAVNGRSRGLMAVPVGEIPTGTRCVQILVPDSDDALKMLMGQLYELTHWNNYERENAHKGTEWAQAWRVALLDSVPIGGCSLQTKIRQDDICTLSWSYDDWVTFDSFDPGACMTAYIDSMVPGMIAQGILDAIQDGTIPLGGGQPGAGSAPTPGSCTTYTGHLSPGSKWHLPCPLQAGDTIHITYAVGGWSIGELAWYCPTGDRYLLGACDTSLHSHVSGDPTASAWHMQLIVNYGSHYVDAMTDVHQIVAGTPSSDIYLMANTALTGVPSGNVDFEVEVCTGIWCFEWDFSTGAGGWTIDVGHYVALTGYQTDLFHPGAEYYRYVEIHRDFTSSQILGIDLWYDLSAGAGSRSCDFRQSGSYPGNIIQHFATQPAGTNQHLSWSGSKTVTRVDVAFVAGFSTGGDPGGTGVLKKIRVRGTGTNPFGSSNC